RSMPIAFSQYGEDTNWWLLQSTLNAMRSTEPDPAFLVITGDMLAHHYYDTFPKTARDHSPQAFRKVVKGTMEFLSLQVRRRFPQSTILVTPGNNDDDCGDYGILAGGSFLQDTAPIARRLARGSKELEQSWQSLGSYDVPYPALRNAR